MYAHLFKLPRNAGWLLTVTHTPCLADGIAWERTYTTKQAALAIAEDSGLIVWNA